MYQAMHPVKLAISFANRGQKINILQNGRVAEQLVVSCPQCKCKASLPWL